MGATIKLGLLDNAGNDARPTRTVISSSPKSNTVGRRVNFFVLRHNQRLDAITSKRHNGAYMKEESRRATVYFDSEIHKALRIKAAQAELSISDIVNNAVRQSLAEDAIDLAAFDERRKENAIDFEQVVKKLRARGKI